MVTDDRAWKRGRISFPIFPTLLVIGAIAIFGAYQFPKHVSAASGYALGEADIRGTKIQSSSGPKVDFIVYLSPAGSKRVSTWAATQTTSEISVAYGDKLMGNLTLTPTMDTYILHLVATPETALTARYAIGK
jgi:hypothetical protein